MFNLLFFNSEASVYEMKWFSRWLIIKDNIDIDWNRTGKPGFLWLFERVGIIRLSLLWMGGKRAFAQTYKVKLDFYNIEQRVDFSQGGQNGSN